MSYSIFTSNPTALIAQPGRAVNTYPSGLVRVDQTYLGLTSQATSHRATLAIGNNMPDGDSSPCIDGLKIFPEVQERRREDGFTEFIVSAYGRVNATGQKTFERKLFSAVAKLDIRYLELVEGGFSQNGVPSLLYNVCTIERLLWKFCAPKNTPVSIISSDVLKVFRLNGEQWEEATLFEFLSETEKPGYFAKGQDQYQDPASIIRPAVTTNSPVSVEKTNFGNFEEWTVVYESALPEFDFRDGIYKIVRAPIFNSNSPLSNLRGGNNAQSVTLGPVWNLATSSGSINENVVQNFVQLGDDDVITYNGKARISGDAVFHSFGYAVGGSAVGGSAEFNSFQRPNQIQQPSSQPGPASVTQGRATWVPKVLANNNDSEGGVTVYGFNLQGGSINDWFRWTVSNEFGQESEFIGRFTFQPEVL